jgi:hypothetical protein
MRAASYPWAAKTLKAAARISSWRRTFCARRRGEDLAAFNPLEVIAFIFLSVI